MSAEPLAGQPGREKRDPFFAAIAALSVSKEDPLAEWIYAGGDGGSHARWFELRYSGKAPPPHRQFCICGHSISENCYIENQLNHTFVVIGNCCIRRYLPENQAGRTCADCGAPHKNRRDAWCAACRGGVLNCGRHKGRSFRTLLDSEGEYCEWIRDSIDPLGDSPLASFALWLEKRLGKRERKAAKMLMVGKHKRETFEEVFAKDRDYCAWVVRQSLNDSMEDFRMWLWQRYREDADPCLDQPVDQQPRPTNPASSNCPDGPNSKSQ